MKDKVTLKEYFKSGDKPTQTQFEDLIVSSLNGIDDKATIQDIENAQNDQKYTTPKMVAHAINNLVLTASTTRKGIAEIATLAEVATGTDTERYVTPQGAKRSVEVFAPVKSVNGQTGDITVPDSTYDSGWVSVLLQNGIQNFANGYVEARYRNLNGVIYIEGTIRGGVSQTNGVNYIIFQLPEGFRPSKKLIFSTFKNGGASGRIDIDTMGNVYGVVYDKNLTSLSGVMFPL